MGDNEKTFDILESLHISLADRMQLVMLADSKGLYFDPKNLTKAIQNSDVFKKDKDFYYFIQNGEILVFEHLNLHATFLACKKKPNLAGESEIYYFVPQSC